MEDTIIRAVTPAAEPSAYEMNDTVIREGTAPTPKGDESRSTVPESVVSPWAVRASGRRRWFGMLAMVLSVVLMVGFLRWNRSPSTQVGPLELVGKSSERVEVTSSEVEPGPVADAEEDPVVISSTTSTSAIGGGEASRLGRDRRRPIRPRPLPVRLLGAEEALRRGNFERAIQLARKGLRETSDARAYGLLSRAYCGKRDLGTARAMLRQTPHADRAQVMRRCAALGMDLE